MSNWKYDDGDGRIMYNDKTGIEMIFGRTEDFNSIPRKLSPSINWIVTIRAKQTKRSFHYFSTKKEAEIFIANIKRRYP